MPFYITHTDGSSLVTVEDGTIDNTSTSLALIGKNFPTYGQYLNQNFVKLTENFANATAPDNSQIGQLWYDSTNKNLKFYREGSTNNAWQKLAMTTESETEPTDPRIGDLWWDTANTQLKLYDTTSNSWRVIGPQTTNNGRLTVSSNNDFNLIIGGNTYLTVTNNGGVNLPYNPCVYGYNHAGVSSNRTTAGAITTWKPIVSVDRGENFDESTGVFTASTSGIYEVYAHVTVIVGTTNGQVTLSWYKNSANANIDAKLNMYSASLAGQTIQLVCKGLISASALDTIKLVYSTQSDATSAISYQNSSYSIRLVG